MVPSHLVPLSLPRRRDCRLDPDHVVFESPAFRRVFEMAKRVAASNASVLIQGESGTGKELIVSTIHSSSGRSDQRFLTVNCAALTETLLESQLFGHVKGAFTGAVATQRGLVEEAHGGSLFLDEIGDISPGLQAKLLRVLHEKEFMPVGSTHSRRADVRFVAATNKDLEQEVSRGHFREDPTTASTWSRCTCPRCGSDARTSPR